MTAQEFLESKIGKFSLAHPFRERDVDYEDVVDWLDEFTAQSKKEIVFPTDEEIRKDLSFPYSSFIQLRVNGAKWAIQWIKEKNGIK